MLIILPDIKFCIKIYTVNHVQTIFEKNCPTGRNFASFFDKKVLSNFFLSFVSDLIQKSFPKNLEVYQDYLIRVIFRFNRRVYGKFGPVRVFPRD